MTAVRDYVHPSDLGRGHTAALGYLLAGYRSDTFNLGTGVGSSVLDVLHALENVSGLAVQREVLPRRVGDCALSVLDIRKAQIMLRYTPRHDLHSMAATAWAVAFATPAATIVQRRPIHAMRTMRKAMHESMAHKSMYCDLGAFEACQMVESVASARSMPPNMASATWNNEG